MKTNEIKSVQVTFTLKKGLMPPVQLNNIHRRQKTTRWPIYGSLLQPSTKNCFMAENTQLFPELIRDTQNAKCCWHSVHPEPILQGYYLLQRHTCSLHGVNTLTLRSLTLYIYGAPILDVSRSHTTTQHSR